jgi:serine/threonine protein kinase/formylglycine-generating enzyme required for sulfatase activity
MSADELRNMTSDTTAPVWMKELCERFREKWNTKEALSIEFMIDRLPAEKRSIALRALITVERELRTLSGEIPAPQEFVQRFPNFKREVLSVVSPQSGKESLARRETLPSSNSMIDSEAEIDSRSLKIPRKLGRYRIERKLGEGAMGVVFLARDELLNRAVALKIPRRYQTSGSEEQIRFKREAQAAAVLHHPNICPIYDVGEIQGIQYISMGFVDGVPLSRYAVQDSGLTEQQIARYMLQIAKALAVAHEAGFIHRDLKPANIMIDQNDSPVVLDFGLARRIDPRKDPRLTQTGVVLGSPCYMAPEQWDGNPSKVGPHSDIYSIGVILYELLAGRVPFAGSPASVMGQILTGTPEKPSARRTHLTVRLESICLKMMAAQPDQRFGSMQAVVTALEEFLEKFGTDDQPSFDESAVGICSPDMCELRKQQIEQLIKAGEYNKAESLLISLSRDRSEALHKYSVWATTELPKLRELREKVRSGRQEIYDTATRLMRAYDYKQVVQILSDYPYDIRTPKMQKLLEHAELIQFEIDRLSERISEAQFRGQRTLLLRLLEQKLELKPNDQEARVLYDQDFSGQQAAFSHVQWLLMILISAAIFTVAAIAVHRKYNPESSDADNHAATIAQRDSGAPIDRDPAESDDPSSAASSASEVPTAFQIALRNSIRNKTVPPLAIAPFSARHANELQSAWTNHLVVAVEPTNAVGMNLRFIPPGEFMMGSSPNEDHQESNERPQHRVRLTRPFYLSVTEVTHWQWFEVVGTRPWLGKESAKLGDNVPTTFVSWNDAVLFCKKLTEQEGVVYRLPTEAEWEYSCRAGSETSRYFGNDLTQLNEHAWWGGESRIGNIQGEKYPHIVGTRKSNAFGLFDMYGNVSEWCQDSYDPFGYRTRTGTTPDPIVKRENMECVVRGGSWDLSSDYCRSAARHHLSPSESNGSCGFRVVREIALSSVQAKNIDALNNGNRNIPNFQAQP